MIESGKTQVWEGAGQKPTLPNNRRVGLITPLTLPKF